MGVGHAGGMALHTKMLLGFAVGAVAGGVAFSFGQTVDAEGVTQAAPWLAATLKWVTQPVGSIFLNLLFMLVLPLVFSALVLGVVEIGDPKALGRIGGKTLAFILVVTGIAVVVAGYPDKMKDFLGMNPGLASRFDHTLKFPDFSNDELVEVFEMFARAHDYVLSPAARAHLLRVVSGWPRGATFANAREVRKLFNDVVMRHSAAVVAGGMSLGNGLVEIDTCHFADGAGTSTGGGTRRFGYL